MIDPVYFPEFFVGNQITYGSCREYAETITFFEILRSVVSHVELDEILVGIRISSPESETLPAIRKCLDGSCCFEVIETTLIVHGHSSYTMFVESPVVVELRFDLICPIAAVYMGIVEIFVSSTDLYQII